MDLPHLERTTTIATVEVPAHWKVKS